MGVVAKTKTIRWIEFWSDASITSGGEILYHFHFCHQRGLFTYPIRNSKMDWRVYRINRIYVERRWVEQIKYIQNFGDVNFISLSSGDGFVRNQAILGALSLTAYRLSNSLCKAKWSSKKVLEALGFDCQKLVKKLYLESVEIYTMQLNQLQFYLVKSDQTIFNHDVKKLHKISFHLNWSIILNCF